MSDFAKLCAADVCDRVLSAPSLLVAGHTNPDGDAVGSCVALCLIARAAGVRSAVFFPDPPQKRLRFLIPEGMEADGPDGWDVVCTVDVPSSAQLGKMPEIAGRASFMIDHHARGEQFAPGLIDPSAAAAGELVFAVYEEMKRRGVLTPSPAAARAMYGAIVADTGSFAYSNTSPETHRIAGELLREIQSDPGGMEPAEISRLLTEQTTAEELYCKMIAAKNLKLYENGRLAVTVLPADELRAGGAEEADGGGAVDVPRSVAGVDVAVALRQKFDTPAEFRVSSRANGDFDVSAVCALFGGGGHCRAAGCTIVANSPEEAVERAVGAFSAILGG